MVLSGSPVAALFLSFCATLAAVALIERHAVAPRAPVAPPGEAASSRPAWAAWAARLYVVLLAYLVFLLISARPVYAFAAASTVFLVFVLITRAKFRFVREPLVFADMALLPLLLRHRELFYANWLGLLFWAGSILYIVAASSVFFLLEPPLLPEARWRRIAAMGLALLLLLPAAALFLPAGRSRAGAAAARVLGNGEPLASTRRLGPVAYVLLHFLQWLGHGRALPPALAAQRGAAAAGLLRGLPDARPPVVLVWQSESFLDMRRFGAAGLRLPVLDRLRAQAARRGLVESVFQGGYTMRTEFSVLTGLPPSALGPDAYYPYLVAGSYAAFAWPRAFRDAGMRTVFLHPYDPVFFHRHRAMPALGFDRLLMRDAFEDDLSGPYVPDGVLGERIVDICRRETESGLFLFCASMENHGPWKPGRVEGAAEAEDIYLRILERSDRALGALVEALDTLDRPVWLLFYGDHAPLLPSRPAGFRDARTDYLILPAGTLKHARGAGEETDSRAWELIADLVACARNEAEKP